MIGNPAIVEITTDVGQLEGLLPGWGVYVPAQEGGFPGLSCVLLVGWSTEYGGDSVDDSEGGEVEDG